MTKQTQQQPQQKEQKQNDSQRGENPDQQGGQNPQGQPGKKPGSQGQPGARQADQGSGGRRPSGSRTQDSQKGAQRAQKPNQQGSVSTEDDESPEMNQAGEQWTQADDPLRQGALDAQYGTSSSSKTGQQTNRPQGSAESSTGSDRDTMSGSRSKGR
jgi:hypothetical protein